MVAAGLKLTCIPVKIRVEAELTAKFLFGAGELKDGRTAAGDIAGPGSSSIPLSCIPSADRGFCPAGSPKSRDKPSTGSWVGDVTGWIGRMGLTVGGLTVSERRIPFNPEIKGGRSIKGSFICSGTPFGHSRLLLMIGILKGAEKDPESGRFARFLEEELSSCPLLRGKKGYCLWFKILSGASLILDISLSRARRRSVRNLWGLESLLLAVRPIFLLAFAECIF